MTATSEVKLTLFLSHNDQIKRAEENQQKAKSSMRETAKWLCKNLKPGLYQRIWAGKTYIIQIPRAGSYTRIKILGTINPIPTD